MAPSQLHRNGLIAHEIREPRAEEATGAADPRLPEVRPKAAMPSIPTRSREIPTRKSERPNSRPRLIPTDQTVSKVCKINELFRLVA